MGTAPVIGEQLQMLGHEEENRALDQEVANVLAHKRSFRVDLSNDHRHLRTRVGRPGRLHRDVSLLVEDGNVNGWIISQKNLKGHSRKGILVGCSPCKAEIRACGLRMKSRKAAGVL